MTNSSVEQVTPIIRHRYINDKDLKPLSATCVATYLRMAEEGVIVISDEEYRYFSQRLKYLTQTK